MLGHHKEQIDSARQADLGHGAALATDDSGAVRAGAGLLLTAHSLPERMLAAGEPYQKALMETGSG